MLRHTLSSALVQLRIRVASGDPSFQAALRFVHRSERLGPKARDELDKLLAAVRAETTAPDLTEPFSHTQQVSQVEVRAWKEACETARRNMASPRVGGLGLTAWEDPGGLSRLESLGLLSLALHRLAMTPEFGAGPLLPGLRR
ncbi:hypothetical protein LZ198_21640 [Myxococcus sp. K15C18031901]|uniref:hypothetical protein n=1 Tax=Myxococcus dinghuensis TaxID=2906761 RepID=UPI0020A71436|nr:hypothetical protein [Myxococcus dinghuensis]MCP3101482.1 hypothetical protein [Myxococcus dinghuensis]